MEEKLNDLIKLKPLQNRVLTLREDIPRIYLKNLNRERKLEVSKLLASQLKLPIQKIDVPPVTPVNLEHFKISPSVDFTKLSERALNVSQCLQYIEKD